MLLASGWKKLTEVSAYFGSVAINRAEDAALESPLERLKCIFRQEQERTQNFHPDPSSYDSSFCKCCEGLHKKSDLVPEQPSHDDFQQQLTPSTQEPEPELKKALNHKWCALVQSSITEQWSQDRAKISCVKHLKCLTLVKGCKCDRNGWQPVEMWFHDACTEKAVVKRFARTLDRNYVLIHGNKSFMTSLKPILDFSKASGEILFGEIPDPNRR